MEAAVDLSASHKYKKVEKLRRTARTEMARGEGRRGEGGGQERESCE